MLFNTKLNRSLVIAWFARFATAFVLITAATLKGVQLLDNPASATLFGSRAAFVFGVTAEFLLSIWLCSGLGASLCKWTVLLTFAVFGTYTLYLAILAKPSCDCFGRVSLDPWITFSLDVTLICLLWLWRPPTWLCVSSRNLRSRAHFVKSMITALTIIGTGVTAAFIMHGSSKANDVTSDTVRLDPRAWVGAALPLRDHIDIGEDLMAGTWNLVFHRHDCPACQKIVPGYLRLAQQAQTFGIAIHWALIEVPPFGHDVIAKDELLKQGKLTQDKSWIVRTPFMVRVVDGTVVEFKSDIDAMEDRTGEPTTDVSIF